MTENDDTDEFREAGRFDGGVTWIAHPDERMQRASHALERDGEVWIVDPVDADGLDDVLDDLGTVAGVVVLLDRHLRDAASVAKRYDVPVYVHASMTGVVDEIDADVARFGDELPDSGFEAHELIGNRFWQEIVLWDPEDRTLVVPEAVGTCSYFLTKQERLGVHPMLRLHPPRKRLGQFDPERVLVGHGAPVFEDASAALTDALTNALRRTPQLYAGTLKSILTGYMVDQVYITAGLLEVMLDMAAERDPQKLSIRLQVSELDDLEADPEFPDELVGLDTETPVFTDFYFPSDGRAVDAVFGVDVTVPHGQTQDRFVSHPLGSDEVSVEDDLQEVVIVAVPPWTRDHVKAYDRSSRRLKLTVLDAAPPAIPFEE